MNREQELRALLGELETPPPGLEQTVNRAVARRRRRRWLTGPAVSLAGLAAAFVLLVNVSMPVAEALSRVPGLDRLAEAVTFSRSLSAAVEHEFVQPIGRQQTENGITVSVEYLIVDQKQVHVFYTVTGAEELWLHVTPRALPAEGEESLGGFAGSSEGNTDGLRHVTLDFVDGTVPSRLRLVMEITGRPRQGGSPPTASVTEDMFKTGAEWEAEHRQETLAELTFLLEFDPDFTAQARRMPVNETVELDGQRLTVTALEIYPTHMRLAVEPDEANSAWLKELAFYVENRRGERYDPASGGITATGDGNGQLVSYRVDSPWFYEERELTLVITGAKWLDKDMERVRLDLETGTADRMPEGTELYRLEKLEKGWIVTVLATLHDPDGPMFSVFTGPWYDGDGTPHEINSWSSTFAYDENHEPMEGKFFESFPLYGCQETAVWLCPTYSRLWTAAEPIRVEIPPV